MRLAIIYCIPDNRENALKIKEGSNDYLQFRTDNGNERIVVWKDLYVVGNLDISGTTTTIDATNLVVEDKNIELGASAAPSDITARWWWNHTESYDRQDDCL